jgi:hypothetical protein
VRTLDRGRYLRGGLLLLVLWCGACTGGHRNALPMQAADYPTEVDLEQSGATAASRYRHPRHVHRYEFDKTEVDLMVPVSRSQPN